MRLRGGIRWHLEVVFFKGERGYCRQGGESKGGSGRSVVATFSGASTVAFWRPPWSVMVGLTLLCRFVQYFFFTSVIWRKIIVNVPGLRQANYRLNIHCQGVLKYT